MSDRIRELLARVDEALADEVTPIPEGAVISTPGLPRVLGLNVLRVENEAVDAATAAAIAEHEQAELPQRLIGAYGNVIGPRLAPGLLDHGYDAHRNLVMVHRGGPPAAPAQAAEVTLDQAAPMLAAFRRTRPYAAQPGMLEQLTELDARTNRALGARDFCAPRGSAPLAGCRLFTIDGAAQIEHVGTLPEARGTGLARAAVGAAIAAVYTDRLDPLFIMADPDDWMSAWYGRMGFEAVGELWEFGREAGARG